MTGRRPHRKVYNMSEKEKGAATPAAATPTAADSQDANAPARATRRGFLTGVRHHRQTASPASLRSGLPHSSAETDRRRMRLTQEDLWVRWVR